MKKCPPVKQCTIVMRHSCKSLKSEDIHKNNETIIKFDPLPAYVWLLIAILNTQVFVGFKYLKPLDSMIIKNSFTYLLVYYYIVISKSNHGIDPNITLPNTIET